MRHAIHLTCLLLVACGRTGGDPSDPSDPGNEDSDSGGGDPGSDSDTGELPVDQDGDGWDVDHDCDDTDPTVLGRATLDGVPMGSLTAALDAAVAGSTITVCPGTHDGPFSANVPVDLSSESGAEATVLTEPSGQYGVLSIVAGSRLAGFTIRGGHGEGAGGGVLLSTSGSLTIEDCVIRDNEAVDGGGLAVPAEADVVVLRTVIDGNRADLGGGIHIGAGATVDLTTSEVTGNLSRTRGGGGVFLDGGTLLGGLVEGNEASWPAIGPPPGGGGVRTTGTVRIEGTAIRGNQAPTGGGVAVDQGRAALVDVEVSDNLAEGVMDVAGEGGGLDCRGCVLTLEGSTAIVGNEAQSGGGLMVVSGEATGGRIEQNRAGWGGGVHAAGGTLRDMTVTGNEATDDAGGVFLVNGGLSNVTVTDNRAQYAAGVNVQVGDVEISDCSLTGNEAVTAGGGVASTAASLRLVRTTVADNTAENGSGVFASGPLVEIVDSAVVRNVSSYGGGGVWVSGGTLTSAGSDWGLALEDNVPDDVLLLGFPDPDVVYTGYGTDATFTCDDVRCDPTASP